VPDECRLVGWIRGWSWDGRCPIGVCVSSAPSNVVAHPYQCLAGCGRRGCATLFSPAFRNKLCGETQSYLRHLLWMVRRRSVLITGPLNWSENENGAAWLVHLRMPPALAIANCQFGMTQMILYTQPNRGAFGCINPSRSTMDSCDEHVVLRTPAKPQRVCEAGEQQCSTFVVIRGLQQYSNGSNIQYQ